MHSPRGTLGECSLCCGFRRKYFARPFGYFVSLCSQNLTKGLAKVSHTFSPLAFRKISLAFRISALRLLAPKTLWRSAERSPALLLQQKHHASRGDALAHGKC